MTDDKVERIKDRVDLEQVARALGLTDLRRRGTGSDLWQCCPFHDEQDPSFKIDPDEGYFKCHGCGEGGDVLDLVMGLKGCEFREALEWLADRTGVQLDDDSDGAQGGKGASASPPRGVQSETAVERLDAGEGELWRARVEYPDGQPHRVRMLESGRVLCDCRGFQHRGRCRHLKAACEKLGGSPRAPDADGSPSSNEDLDQGAEPDSEPDGSGPAPPTGGSPPSDPNERDGGDLTVRQLAHDKDLPTAMLRDLGCRNVEGGVRIPYFDFHEGPVGVCGTPRPRLRAARSASTSGGSRWTGEGDEPIVPYGRWRLSEAREAGYLTLVEGESDCWTLWQAGEPALGIPGASMMGKLEAGDVSGIGRVYLVREPDQAGRRFVRGVLERLIELDYRGEAYVLPFEDEADDPNAAWQQCEGDAELFRKGWQRKLDGAEPVDWPVSDPQEWEPREIARLFLEEGEGAAGPEARRSVELVFWRDQWWEWTGSNYRKVNDSELRACLSAFVEGRKWVKEKRGEKYTTRQSATRQTVRNAVQSLEGRCWVPNSMEPPVWLDSGREADETLVLENGVLELDRVWEACATWEKESERSPLDCELLPHSPDLFALNTLPPRFDPEADCPRWMQFLDEVLPREGAQWVLQQWLGYLLVPTNRYQRILVMKGEGANGKSVIQGVVRDLLGAENCSAAPLEQLHETHALQPLVGKLVNLATEWGYIDQTGLNTMKAVSGQDTVTVNPKWKEPFEARLPVRWMVSTNETPRVQDRSDAIWRRLIVLPFRVQVPDEAEVLEEYKGDLEDREAILEAHDGPVQDETLPGKLREELPGILNWALLGLRALERQGGFELPRYIEDQTETVRAESNPAATWCEDYLEVTEGERVSTQECYEMYEQWAKDRGYRPLNKAHFGREVNRWHRREVGEKVERARPRVDGGARERVYKGVRLCRELEFPGQGN